MFSPAVMGASWVREVGLLPLIGLGIGAAVVALALLGVLKDRR
jgi:hypothetical protein